MQRILMLFTTAVALIAAPAPAVAAQINVADMLATVISGPEAVARATEAGIAPVTKWKQTNDEQLTREQLIVAHELHRLRHTLRAGLLDDVIVVVLPIGEGFKADGDTDKKVALVELLRDYTHSDIFVAGEQEDLARNLRHEIGHVVAWRLLNAFGEDWSDVNEAGCEYLKLRGYPAATKLDAQSQDQLTWEDRAAEWFAEDFAWWVTPACKRADFNYKARADHPVTVDGLQHYFEELVSCASACSQSQLNTF